MQSTQELTETLAGGIPGLLGGLAERVVDLPAYFPPRLRAGGAAAFDRLYQPPNRLLALSDPEGRPDDPEDLLEARCPPVEAFATAPSGEYVAWNGCLATPGRQVLLCGGPGAGKTWLLRAEARRIAREGAAGLEAGELPPEAVLLPLYAPLSALDPSLPLLVDAVLSWSSIEPGTPEASWARDRLRCGCGVVLLDGWDEAATSPEDRRELAARIEVFCRAYPRARLLIAGREVPAEAPFLRDAQRLAVPSWDDYQAYQFVRAWFEGMATEGTLMARLDADDRLRATARSPLVLALLCLAFEREAPAVENGRACLFDACLRAWVKEGELSREAPGSEVELLSLLAEAALILFTEGVESYPEARVAAALDQALRSRTEVLPWQGAALTAALRRIGLLRGESGQRVRFLHQSFHEHLAARGLAAKGDWHETAACYRCDPRWREVLVGLAGQLGERAGVYVEGLRIASRQDVLRRPLSLAAEAIAEAGAAVPPEVVRRVVADVQRWCQTAKANWRFWRPSLQRALEALSRSEIAQTALQEGLRQGRPGHAAARELVLGVMGARRIDETLLLFAREADPKMREAAAAGLGDRTDLRSLAALVDLAGDPEPAVRRAVAESLSRQGAELATRALLLLARDGDEETRDRAVQALGVRGDPRGIAPALELLERSGLHAGVAIEALGRLRASEAVPALLRRIALRPALERTEIPSRRLVPLFLPPELMLAARALGEIGDPRAVPVLRELADAPELGAVPAALEALARIPHPYALDTLFEFAAEPGRRTLDLVRALGATGAERALPLLAEWAWDRTRPEVMRAASAETLGRFGQAALPHLLLLLRGEVEFPRVRAGAVRGAGRIITDETRAALGELLEVPVPQLRFEAALALSGGGDRRAVPELLRWLVYRLPRVRVAVAATLGRVGGTAELPFLLAALADADPEVRIAVLQALREIGEREAIPVPRGRLTALGAVRHRLSVAWNQAGAEPLTPPAGGAGGRPARS